MNSGETFFLLFLIIAFLLISPCLVDYLSYWQEKEKKRLNRVLILSPQKQNNQKKKPKQKNNQQNQTQIMQNKKLESNWQNLPTSDMQIPLCFLPIYGVQIMASYTAAVKRQLVIFAIMLQI